MTQSLHRIVLLTERRTLALSVIEYIEIAFNKRPLTAPCRHDSNSNGSAGHGNRNELWG